MQINSVPGGSTDSQPVLHPFGNSSQHFFIAHKFEVLLFVITNILVPSFINELNKILDKCSFSIYMRVKTFKNYSFTGVTKMPFFPSWTSHFCLGGHIYQTVINGNINCIHLCKNGRRGSKRKKWLWGYFRGHLCYLEHQDLSLDHGSPSVSFETLDKLLTFSKFQLSHL